MDGFVLSPETFKVWMSVSLRKCPFSELDKFLIISNVLLSVGLFDFLSSFPCGLSGYNRDKTSSSTAPYQNIARALGIHRHRSWEGNGS